MITKSNPFLRNDYYPDQNDIDDLNTRINEVQSDVDLLAISVNEKAEAVNGRLNNLQDNYNESFETDALKANTADFNVLNVNVQAVVKDLNVIDTYTENLIVNKPVQDLALRTPHLENTTSLNGNFYAPNILDAKFSGDISGNLNNVTANDLLVSNANIINAKLSGDISGNLNSIIVNDLFANNANLINVNLSGDTGNLNNIIVNDLLANTANISNLYVNTSLTPVQSSAVLGYDSEGRVIPIHATYDVGFPENADYLWTDQAGTAFSGVKATEVGEVENLITAYGVKNAIDALNVEITSTINALNTEVTNAINALNTEVINNVNNISNNLDSLLSTLRPVLGSVTNVSGWMSSMYPLHIQDMKEFRVAPFMGPTMTGEDVGNGAKLNVNDVVVTLGFPSLLWTMENMSQTFYNCNNLNQNIQIPDGVVNMYRTFSYCGKLNQNILIPNGVVDMTETFSFCNSINQNIQIPNGVVNMYGTFMHCTKLNQNILIPNGVTNMSQTFSTCENLNQNIQIPDGVTDMYETFFYCTNLNQNILIPNSVTNMFETFYSCMYLNQSILIPNSVTNVAKAFGGCFYLNQNILIPNSVVDMFRTFDGCQKLNQNILIPNSVTNMFETFNRCRNLNQSILIPNSVVNMVEVFCDCSNLNQSDIYIYSQNLESLSKAFNGCQINNVHIPTSVPKDTSNLIYNSLVNGNTGITFPAANIFNDLPVDIEQWPPV